MRLYLYLYKYIHVLSRPELFCMYDACTFRSFVVICHCRLDTDICQNCSHDAEKKPPTASYFVTGHQYSTAEKVWSMTTRREVSDSICRQYSLRSPVICRQFWPCPSGGHHLQNNICARLFIVVGSSRRKPLGRCYMRHDKEGFF